MRTDRANVVRRTGVGYRILSESQIKAVHQASLQILDRTGVFIQSKAVRDLLADAGCKVNGDKVHIPPHLVEWAIDVAPSQFLLYDRNGQNPLNIGGHNTYFGLGPTLLNMLDPETGKRRRFTKGDTQKAVRLVDGLPNVDWAMAYGTISDHKPEHSDRHEFEAMVENTSKPLVIWSYTTEGLKDIVDMASMVAGSQDKLIERPFIVSYSEPISPLMHDKTAGDKLLLAADYGIPIIHTPVSQGGASSPVTLAGTLAMANAENLSGLVISQLRKQGVPFVVGGVISIMDMANAQLSYGAPELDLLMAAYMDIAHYYELPTWGTGGCTDSKLVDQQAAIEATLSVLFSALSGANLVHDVGYMESGSTGSLEMIAMVDEIIGQVKRIVRGITVDEDHLAIDVIDEVGPGGNYLTTKHTMKYFKDEVWYPTLMDRQNIDRWKKTGEKTMGDRIKDKVQYILSTHEPAPLPEDVLASLASVTGKLE
jgi:trimethylamine--corrinoid protein Co-methyltransferase